MKKLNKKAQVVLYIYFIIAAISIVVIAGFMAPMGVRFNAAMYAAGEDIIEDSLADIEGISDLTVRTQVNDTVHNALDASATNITVNANIFQYSWVVMILLVGLIVFIQTRRLTEVGAGGFV